MRTYQDLYAEIADGLVASRFCIKAGYITRSDNLYFSDTLQTKYDVIHQPQIYPLAAFLAERYDCKTIVDIGCGRAGKLAALADQFDIVGVDYGENLEFCRANYTTGKWIDSDLEKPVQLALDNGLLGEALIICSDDESFASSSASSARLRSVMSVAMVT